jgi:hypothetical protein
MAKALRGADRSGRLRSSASARRHSRHRPRTLDSRDYGRDSLNPPYDSSDEADGGEEVSRQLVVSSGDASEVLEPTEGILDAVALSVGFSVEAERLLAVGLVGNDGLGAAIFQPLSQWRAIIGLVAEKLCGGFDANESGAGQAGNRAPGRRSAGGKEDGL